MGCDVIGMDGAGALEESKAIDDARASSCNSAGVVAGGVGGPFTMMSDFGSVQLLVL